MKASSKGVAPDQMDMYLESIASTVGPDYSQSMSPSKSQGARGNVAEPLDHASECFGQIYWSLVKAEVSDPEVLGRTIDAVTSVDKGVQLLLAAEAPTDEKAQARLDIKKALDVLKAQDPTILEQVERCLASSLSPEWQAKIVK